MQRRNLVIAAAVLVLVAWWLWPSQRVRNRDSHGKNVIAFGDSLTAGYGAAAGDDYPSKLAALAGTPIINAGVSGDTTQAALARIDADVLSKDPRIVIVGLGGNDFLGNTPIAATEANLRKIVKKIQDAGAMVILLGFEFPSFGPRYDNMYERVAKDEQCLLVQDVLDDILSDPKLKSDEIHPNAKGYAIMAERIDKPLRSLLR